MTHRGKSLAATLHDLGLSHRKVRGGHGMHTIHRGEEVVFTGRARDVWEWLRATGQIAGAAGVPCD